MPRLRRCGGTKTRLGHAANKAFAHIDITRVRPFEARAIMFRVVVLPHPLGPSSVTTSPLFMVSETSSTAVTSPKYFTKPFEFYIYHAVTPTWPRRAIALTMGDGAEREEQDDQ